MSETTFIAKDRIETDTLLESIRFGLVALGNIPRQYNKPSILSLRRRYSTDSGETMLTAITKDQIPETFILSTLTSLTKPTNTQGNASALARGIYFGHNNGQSHVVSGAYVEVALTCNLYSSSMEPILSWVTQALQHPTLRGMLEFGDGGMLNVNIEIGTSFDWQDPIDPSETSASTLEKLYSVGFTAKICTVSALVESKPLFKMALLDLKTKGVPSNKDYIEITPPDDTWP